MEVISLARYSTGNEENAAFFLISSGHRPDVLCLPNLKDDFFEGDHHLDLVSNK